MDTSSEALAINAAKLAGSTIPVRYIQANVFEWRPDRRYDVVCFAFWLSHVPKPLFEEFWSLASHSPEARAKLQAYDWPGNVRELENTMLRAALLASGSTIRGDDISLARSPSAGAAADTITDPVMLGWMAQ